MVKYGLRSMIRDRYACRPRYGGCGAAPEEHCITRTGKLSAEVHADRWHQYQGVSTKPLEHGNRVGYD
jgi:hypothetical protein